jgi:hypothetical protein
VTRRKREHVNSTKTLLTLNVSPLSELSVAVLKLYMSPETRMTTTTPAIAKTAKIAGPVIGGKRLIQTRISRTTPMK